VRKPKIHDQAACPGVLVRVYERPERSGSLSPIGYVCKRCSVFLPDPPILMTLADLRPSTESLAIEISNLLLDRQVHERVAGMVRSNKALLRAAQTGNPFLQGTRRWWATSAALVLRRHLDGGTRSSLRDILEALATLQEDGLTGPRFDVAKDLGTLKTLSERFGPYLNAVLYGAQSGADVNPTFTDMNDAITEVAAIAGRVYAAVTNVSHRMDPAIQFDWTEIFREPWIPDDTPMAYVLGEIGTGVPFDALPLTKTESQDIGRLALRISSLSDGHLEITVTNEGRAPVLDVRVFLPFNRTVVDVPELAVGMTIRSHVPPQDSQRAYGQAVLEFADAHAYIYRQYAEVDLDIACVRKLSPTPYRVSGRIVERKLQGAS
jgi:hypothetical protein